MDRVHYRLPAGTRRVEVRVLYQSLSPDLVSHLAGIEHADIAAFLDYYSQQGNEPVVVRTLSRELSGGLDEPAAPPDWQLQEPHPNPFNGRLEIPLELAQESPVDLRLYNLRGQAVMQIFEGRLPAGRHELHLETAARELASGPYWLGATVGGERRFRRVTLLR